MDDRLAACAVDLREALSAEIRRARDEPFGARRLADIAEAGRAIVEFHRELHGEVRDGELQRLIRVVDDLLCPGMEDHTRPWRDT